MNSAAMHKIYPKKYFKMDTRTQASVLALLIIIIDQISKFLINHFLYFGESLRIMPGFDLVLRHNKGAAFSFLSEASGWQRWFFVVVAVVMITGIFIWLGKLSKEDRLERFALSLILGGALGNLIDRIYHGYVVDFILLYYKDYAWPAFNIADSAISIGVCLLAWDIFKKR